MFDGEKIKCPGGVGVIEVHNIYPLYRIILYTDELHKLSDWKGKNGRKWGTISVDVDILSSH